MAPSQRKALATVLALPATLFIGIIRLYQMVLSPDYSWLRHLYPYGFCRHEPTCSDYAVETLRSRNLFVALGKIALRILSCNPWKKPSDRKMEKVILRELRM